MAPVVALGGALGVGAGSGLGALALATGADAAPEVAGRGVSADPFAAAAAVVAAWGLPHAAPKEASEQASRQARGRGRGRDGMGRPSHTERAAKTPQLQSAGVSGATVVEPAPKNTASGAPPSFGGPPSIRFTSVVAALVGLTFKISPGVVKAKMLPPQ